MDFGLPELLVVLLIVLLLFGSTRLPKLSRSIGESMRELRDGLVGKESPSDNRQEQSEQKEETQSEPTVSGETET